MNTTAHLSRERDALIPFDEFVTKAQVARRTNE
jgi:hypothetical protein